MVDGGEKFRSFSVSDGRTLDPIQRNLLEPQTRKSAAEEREREFQIGSPFSSRTPEHFRVRSERKEAEEAKGTNFWGKSNFALITSRLKQDRVR